MSTPPTFTLQRMGRAGLKVLSDAVKRLDPGGLFVTLDVDAQTVTYSPGIIQHERIMKYTGEEEPARAYLIAWLCTDGGYLPQNIELEKRYTMGRPGANKPAAELDILINRIDGTPFALIEVKAPDEYIALQDGCIKGQLFDIVPFEVDAKVLSYATVTTSSTAVQIHTITIDYSNRLTFDKWVRVNGRASSDTLAVNYNQPVHQHYVKGGSRDLRTDVKLSEFQAKRTRLHDVLWKGTTDDNTIYAYIVRLFLAKIHDEKITNTGEEYKFQIKYIQNIKEDPAETYKRVKALYEAAYKRYLGGGKSKAPEGLNDKEFKHTDLAFVVSLLENISITKNMESNADLLGTFFEGITQSGYKQGKGSYFTHVNLVVFILKVLNIEEIAEKKIKSSVTLDRRLPYIMDSSCGSGTFLLSAMNMISRYVTTHRNQIGTNDDAIAYIRNHFPGGVAGDEHIWAKEYLYGIDANELVAMAAKVNMVLQKDGNMHIIHADGLAPLDSYQDDKLRGREHHDTTVYSKLVAETFDIVVSNPPFGITLAPETIASLDVTFELANDKNSENLFVERWYQLLVPKGRLGAVLPESFFSTQENLDVRLFLFAHFNVKAVVSLPRHAFEPFTPTKTSILFAEKKSIEEEQLFKKSIDNHKHDIDLVKLMALSNLNKLLNALKYLMTSEDAARLAGEAAKRLQINVPEFAELNQQTPQEVLQKLEAWQTEKASLPLQKPAGPDAKLVEKFIKDQLQRLQVVQTIVPILATHHTGLELPVPFISLDMSLEDLLRHTQHLRQEVTALDTRVFAFRKVVEQDDATFVVLNVKDIGYKRTKRSELARLNSLFTAYTGDPENPNSIRVNMPNLHESSPHWWIDVDHSGAAQDALSQLAGMSIWD